MGREVDNRVVQMTFDNAQFEKGVSTTLNSLDKLDKALEFKDADKSFSSLTRAANSLDLSSASKSIEKCSSTFSTLESIGLGFFKSVGEKAFKFAEDISNAFLGIPKKILSSGFGEISNLINGSFFTGWDKLRQTQEATRTIMSATVDAYEDEGEQIADIENRLKNLMWYADETSYSFTDMTNNIGKFTAQKIPLEQAQTAMIGISNWAAMAGQGTDAAARAMYNLSQSLGTGHVQLIDWKSVENANMATSQFKELALETAANLGKLKRQADGTFTTIDGKTKITAASFRDSLKSGWFDNEALMKTLGYFGTASEEIKNLLDESGDNATSKKYIEWIEEYKAATGDAVAQSEILQRAQEATGVSTDKLAEKFDLLTSEEYYVGVEAYKAASEYATLKAALAGVEDAASSAWMGIFKGMMGDFDQQRAFWTAFESDIETLFVEPLNKAKAFVEDLYTYLGSANDTMPIHMNALINVFHIITEVITQFREGISGLGPDIGDVASAIIKVHTWTETFLSNLRESGWVFNFVDSFRPIIGFIQNALSAVFTLAKGLFSIVAPLFGLAKDAIMGIWMTISDLFEILNESSAVSNVVDTISNAFKSIAGLVTTVVTPIRSVVRNVFSSLQNALSTIVKIVGGPFVLVWRTISFVFNKLIVPAISLLSKFLNKLSNTLGGKLSSASDRFHRIWSKITPILQQAGEFLRTVFIAAWKEVVDTFKTVKPLFEEIWNTIKDVFSSIGDKIGSTFDKIKKVFGLGGNPFTNMQVAISRMFGAWRKEDGTASKMHDFFEKIRNGATGTNGVLTKVSEIFTKFKNLLISKWEGGGKDTFTAVLEKIKNALVKIKDFGGSALDKIKEFFRSFSNKDETEQGAEQLGKTADKVNIFAKALEFLKNVAEKAVDLLKNVVRYILDTLGGEGASVADVLKGIGSGSIMLGLGSLTKSLSGMFDWLKEFLENLAGLKLDHRTGLEKLADALWSISKSIALMLGAMLVCVVVLSRYDSDELFKVYTAIGAFLTIIYAFGKKMKDIDFSMTDSKDLLVMAMSIVAMSTALNTMVKAVKKLGKMKPEQLEQGIKGMIIIVIALAGLAIALKDKSLGSFSSGGGLSKKAMGGLLTVALSIYVIAMAVSKIAKVASTNEKAFDKAFNTLLGMFGGLIMLGLIFKENDVLGSNGNFKDIGTGMLLIAAGMLVLASAIQKMGELNRDAFAQGIEGLITLVITFGLAILALKKVDGKNFLSLAGGMALLAVAFGLLVPTIATLGLLPIKVLAKGLGAIAAGLLVLIGAAFLAGKVVPGLTALSAVFVSIGATVALIGAGFFLAGAGIALLAVGLGQLTVTGVAGMTAFVLMLDILLDGLSGLITKIALFGVELFVTFVEGLAAQVSRLVPAVVTILKAILDGIYELTPSLMAALMALGEMLIVLLKTFLIDILDSITETLPNLEALLETIITLAITLIANGLTTLITMLLDFIIDVLDAIAEKTPDIVDAVGNIIVAVIEGIGRLAPDVVTALLAAANMWLDALVDAFDPNNDKTGSVSRLIEATIQLIWNIIGCFFKALGDIVDIGAQMIGALWDGLFGDGLENEENSDKLVWKIIRAITDAVSKAWQELKNVGKRIWNALFGGMTNAAEEEKIGENVGRNVQRGYERVTKTNSPSKLFEWEGKMLDAGLAKGIEDNKGAVLDSVTGLRDVLTNAFASSSSIIQSLIDGQFSDPTIRPTLDLSEVISGANGISGMFGNETIGLDSVLGENGDMFGGTNGTNGVTFIQNNYSPKSLSRLEIYRQTQNQLSTIKGVVNGA